MVLHIGTYMQHIVFFFHGDAVWKQKNYRGSFQFSIVTILKIPSLRKPEIIYFRHFPKLQIAYFSGGKILQISLNLNFPPNDLGCHGFRLPLLN